MTDQKRRHDPTDDPSYRAAVQAATHKQIALIATWGDGRWTVTARRRYGSSGMPPSGMEATGTGRTAGHAAWQALAELES